ncbi:hypothetical protein C8R47DRAFT_806162 [Mycena vitilis]|nr:hypothetical protein C8R47DRAFT_806162 [Mycena vitilis]
MHPLAAVLNSNRPPTEQEALGIRSLLQELDSTQMESKSSRHEGDPEPQQWAVQRQILVVSLRSALSAMRLLPAEILDSRCAPVLLTHVCARWRMVALGMPQLWNRVTLLTDIFFDGRKSFVQEILDRSRQVPLSVALLSPPQWTTMRLEGTSLKGRWLDIIWLCSHRLEHISLDVYLDDAGSNVMPTQTVFPILASVNIEIEGNGEPDLNAILEAFQSSPLLRSLKMSVQLAYNDDIFDAVFPWSQLTYMDFGAPLTIVGARDILANCGALQTAKLRGVFDPESDDPTPPRAIWTLSHLAVLELSIDSRGGGVAFVLDSFTFPRLSSLRIASEGDQPTDALLALHERSQLPLTYLSLVRQDLTLPQLVSLLRVLPILETLVMENCDSIIRALLHTLADDAAASGNGRVLTHPHLTVLEIQGVTHVDGNIVARAAEYLAAHAGDPTAAFPMLRTLRLYTRHPTYPSLIARFADDLEADLPASLAAWRFVYLYQPMIPRVTPSPA